MEALSGLWIGTASKPIMAQVAAVRRRLLSGRRGLRLANSFSLGSADRCNSSSGSSGSGSGSSNSSGRGSSRSDDAVQTGEQSTCHVGPSHRHKSSPTAAGHDGSDAGVPSGGQKWTLSSGGGGQLPARLAPLLLVGKQLLQLVDDTQHTEWTTGHAPLAVGCTRDSPQMLSRASIQLITLHLQTCNSIHFKEIFLNAHQSGSGSVFTSWQQ